MARIGIGDALRPDEDEPPARRAPAPDPLDRYKLTVVLESDEHDALEVITAKVLDELAPRRVGKGWRTKVIRALITAAADDEKLRARIVEALRPDVN